MNELDLTRLSVAGLGRLYRHVLAEMQDRGVIRTGNAPVGDYAQWLVAQATEGSLVPNSQASWDVETPDGERLQVKARFVLDPKVRGQRQLSAFRSWEFDAAVIVLFDDDFIVWRAAKLDPAMLREASSFSGHVHGYRVTATDGMLGQGIDWTERLRKEAGVSS